MQIFGFHLSVSNKANPKVIKNESSIRYQYHGSEIMV